MHVPVPENRWQGALWALVAVVGFAIATMFTGCDTAAPIPAVCVTVDDVVVESGRCEEEQSRLRSGATQQLVWWYALSNSSMAPRVGSVVFGGRKVHPADFIARSGSQRGLSLLSKRTQGSSVLSRSTPRRPSSPGIKARPSVRVRPRIVHH